MKKLKWNWGTGIALTLVLFIGLMGTMVYKATQQNFDLVSDTYYLDELNYQTVIDQKRNVLLLKSEIQIKTTDGLVQLLLPKDFMDLEKTINLHLYCEKNAQLDVEVPVQTIHENVITLPFPKNASGRWLVKTSLQCQGTGYYFQPEIVF